MRLVNLREVSGSNESLRPLATTNEVSEYYGVSVTTLYQWRHRGMGPKSVKVGHYVRYRWEDVERWLDEQSRAAA